jgi:hypothetical protein
LNNPPPPPKLTRFSPLCLLPVLQIKANWKALILSLSMRWNRKWQTCQTGCQHCNKQCKICMHCCTDRGGGGVHWRGYKLISETLKINLIFQTSPLFTIRTLYRPLTFHVPYLMPIFPSLGICPILRSSVTNCRKLICYGEELVPYSTTKLEDHPLSAVHDCLFNTFAATLHIWRPSHPFAAWGWACHDDKGPTKPEECATGFLGSTTMNYTKSLIWYKIRKGKDWNVQGM